MKLTVTEKQFIAFELGYHDGRIVGVESNPYSEDEAEQHAAYNEGFTQGSDDFAADAHPQGH